MNTDHTELLPKFVEIYGNEKLENVFMYMLDSLGFNLMGNSLNKEKEWVNVRLPFPYPLKNEQEAILALKEAMEKLEIKIQQINEDREMNKKIM